MKLKFQGNIKAPFTLTDKQLNGLSATLYKSWEALEPKDLIDDEAIVENIDYISIFSDVDYIPEYSVEVVTIEELDADEVETIFNHLNIEIDNLNEYLSSTEEFKDIHLEKLKAL